MVSLKHLNIGSVFCFKKNLGTYWPTEIGQSEIQATPGWILGHVVLVPQKLCPMWQNHIDKLKCKVNQCKME